MTDESMLTRTRGQTDQSWCLRTHEAANTRAGGDGGDERTGGDGCALPHRHETRGANRALDEVEGVRVTRPHFIPRRRVSLDRIFVPSYTRRGVSGDIINICVRDMRGSLPSVN